MLVRRKFHFTQLTMSFTWPVEIYPALGAETVDPFVHDSYAYSFLRGCSY